MISESFFYLDSEGFNPEDSFFCGFGVSTKSVIIGSLGYEQYLRDHRGQVDIPRMGRFVGCFPGDGKTIVKTDDMGQELLFLYRSSDYKWAISNSYWLLAYNLRKRGVPLALYDVSHRAFELKNGKHIGEQFLSERTSIENVVLVSSSQQLEIDHRDKKLSIVGQSLYDYLHSFSGSSEDLIVDHLEEQLGIFQVLSANSYDLQCDLSGGYDSRVAFGLAARSGASMHVRSLEGREEEFSIAKDISSRFGFSVNIPFGKGTDAPGLKSLDSSLAVDFWELSSGGTYLPIYPISRASSAYGKQVSIGGDVCYGFSFFAGTAKFNGSCEKIYNDILNSYADARLGGGVAKEFLRGVESTGAPEGSAAALQLYYSSFRARFHGGRNSYKVPHGRLRLTPLLSSKLLSASVRLTSGGADSSQLIRDLYAAVNPELAKFPFIGDKKDVDYDGVRCSKLIGVDLRPRQYKLYNGEGITASRNPLSSSIDSYVRSGVPGEDVGGDFRMELNSRMEFLKSAYAKLISEELQAGDVVMLDDGINLASGARGWTRRYFTYKLLSLLDARL